MAGQIISQILMPTKKSPSSLELRKIAGSCHFHQRPAIRAFGSWNTHDLRSKPMDSLHLDTIVPIRTQYNTSNWTNHVATQRNWGCHFPRWRSWIFISFHITSYLLIIDNDIFINHLPSPLWQLQKIDQYTNLQGFLP